MTPRLRSMTPHRPRAVLMAAVGVLLLLAPPAAANCSPLDELPTVVVPAPKLPVR